MSPSIARLLAKTSFKSDDCRSALAGQALPRHLGNPVVRLCVVNGLRKHLDFALSTEVNELCEVEDQDIFARARNAGLIMNDRVPDDAMMRNKSWHPYCIWYPRVAKEATYRQLAMTFPDMRYQVGRACAVAGYSQLYKELDLLPDPCIAEEARENKSSVGSVAEGARQIYEQIMSAPIRFGVMNDYERTVQLQLPAAGVFLNADTAVLATLTPRKKFGKYFRPVEDSAWRYFDITEDQGIDDHTVKAQPHDLDDGEIELFSSPLPADLPTVHKDLLILVAAFEGNLDRYARLRRPGRTIDYELHCVLPGVYKSFAMANWLHRNPELVQLIAASWHPDEVKTLRRAIHARWVMNNDVYRLCTDEIPDDELPYWIWYPTIPSAWTLLKLAESRLAMRPQCARACIAAGMRDPYAKIMDMCDADAKPVTVDRYLMHEARSCSDREFFESDLLRRMTEQGLDALLNDGEEWKENIPWREADVGSTFLSGTLQDTCHSVVSAGQDWGIYENLGAELGRVRLYLSSPPAMRARAAQARGNIMNLEDEDLIMDE